MKKILFVIFLSSSITYSFANDYKECQQLASTLNEGFPMQINEYTKIMGTICAPAADNKEKITFIYMYNVLNRNIKAPDVKSERTSQLRSWCTDPDQKLVLSLYDIEYKYQYVDGTFIAINRFQEKNCN